MDNLLKHYSDDVFKDCSDADCHNGPHPFLYFPMCSCSTTVDVVLMQCHDSLKTQLAFCPGFCLAALEKNRNRKPGLEASYLGHCDLLV